MSRPSAPPAPPAPAVRGASEELVERVIAAVRGVVGDDARPVSLHEPLLAGREWELVRRCLDSTMVSSVGEFVDRFEEQLAAFAGVEAAVATVNGTAALHLGLTVLGVVPGDEVLVPAMTFVATANAVRYCGAEPHFVDSTHRTLGVDPAKLRRYLAEIVRVQDGVAVNRHSGRPVRAMVPMHTFGHPVEIDELLEVCEAFHLALLEDAAQGLGSRYRGRQVGGFGRLGTLSFNGNKIITTGGGGAILTRDRELAQHAKHLSTTAKRPHRWEFFHDHLGYNYRMPNINAALGCAQLEQLPGFIERKRRLAERYRIAFQEVPGVELFLEPPEAHSNYWLNALLLEEGDEALRDGLLAAAHEAGLLMRPPWVCLHRLPIFADCPRMDLTVAEELERRIVNLPSGAFLEPV